MHFSIYATCGYDHLKGGFGRVPLICSGVSFESHGGVSLQWIHLDRWTLLLSLWCNFRFQFAFFTVFAAVISLCGAHERGKATG